MRQGFMRFRLGSDLLCFQGWSWAFDPPAPLPEIQDYRCVPSQPIYTVLKVDLHCACDQHSLSRGPPSRDAGLCPWFDFCTSLGCFPWRQLCLPTLSLSPHYMCNDNLLFHISWFRNHLSSAGVCFRLKFLYRQWRQKWHVYFWVSLPIIWFYLLSLIKFYIFSIKLLNVPCVYAVGFCASFSVVSKVMFCFSCSLWLPGRKRIYCVILTLILQPETCCFLLSAAMACLWCLYLRI